MDAIMSLSAGSSSSNVSLVGVKSFGVAKTGSTITAPAEFSYALISIGCFCIRTSDGTYTSGDGAPSSTFIAANGTTHFIGTRHNTDGTVNLFISILTVDASATSLTFEVSSTATMVRVLGTALFYMASL